MSQSPGVRTDGGKDEIYRSLAHHRRRRVLAILVERSSPLDEAALAERVLAAESGGSIDDAAADADSVLVDLRHAQLPLLADVGLVEYDRDDGTVSAAVADTPHESSVRAQLRRLDPSWDPIISALANRRRRLVVRIVGESDASLDVSELARIVTERERRADDLEADAGARARERTLASLRHAHLPALSDAGVLAYDRAAGTVAVPGRVGADRTEDDARDVETDERSRGRRVPVLGSL